MYTSGTVPATSKNGPLITMSSIVQSSLPASEEALIYPLHSCLSSLLITYILLIPQSLPSKADSPVLALVICFGCTTLLCSIQFNSTWLTECISPNFGFWILLWGQILYGMAFRRPLFGQRPADDIRPVLWSGVALKEGYDVPSNISHHYNPWYFHEWCRVETVSSSAIRLFTDV